MSNDSLRRCGNVSIIGHPNVGKSTLMNEIIGYKVSAIANKPQTTRNVIHGILTEKDHQIIFMDTPGIHIKSKSLLNKTINREAISALETVDVVVMLVEAMDWTKEDDFVLKRLENVSCPVFLLVNKVDRVKKKDRLLSYMQDVTEKYNFAEVFPVSAEKGINTQDFVKSLIKYLSESEFIYPEDYITDQSMRFICSEFIREQLMHNLHQEVPYLTAVEIEEFEETDKITKIHATIWVGRKNQKGIIIGHKGETLKRIGSESRRTLEEFLMNKVYLKLWVKVEENWHNNAKHLKELGILDSSGS